MGARKLGLVVHEEKCMGCGNCVEACPVNEGISTRDQKVSIGQKLVLRVESGVARVVNVSLCGRFSADPVLKDCRVCADICPAGAIELAENQI